MLYLSVYKPYFLVRVPNDVQNQNDARVLGLVYSYRGRAVLVAHERYETMTTTTGEN